MNERADRDLTTIYQRATEYLSVEQQVLESILESLSAVRRAIIRRDTDAIHSHTDQLDRLNKQREQLSMRRTEIQRGISRALGIPEHEATLGLLAGQLSSSHKQQLDKQADIVRHLVHEADRTNRVNLSIISHFARLTQSMVETLTGQPIVNRYGKSGQVDSSHTRPMFQTDY